MSAIEDRDARQLERDEAKVAADFANAACDKKDDEIARLVGEVEILKKPLATKDYEENPLPTVAEYQQVLSLCGDQRHDLQRYKEALEKAKVALDKISRPNALLVPGTNSIDEWMALRGDALTTINEVLKSK